MAKHDTGLRQYAVIGAEQRLLQIAEEARHIFRAFPELRGRGRGFQATAAGEHFRWPFARQERAGAARDGESRQPPVKRRRRRRKLTAEARKRISDAVKARWARQKGQAAASTATPTAAGKRTTGRKKR